MISKTLNIPYYSGESLKPTIVSPKNDTHWASSRTVNFDWKYNGQDFQFEYIIEIFKIPMDYFLDEDAYWSSYLVGETITDYTAQEIIDQAYALEYISTDVLATYVYQTGTITSIETETTIDLSSFLVDDGDYRWRIRTRGFVSRIFSLFADDGLVRLDAGSPVIRNVCAESIYATDAFTGLRVNYPSVTAISDLSSPFMYKSSSGVDYKGIDGATSPGFYIYYDYKDNAIVLRARGTTERPTRYYGIITFHGNSDSEIDAAEPRFFVDEVVDSVIPYTVDRNTDAFGPYEQSSIVDNKYIPMNPKYSLTSTNEETEQGQGIPYFFPFFFRNYINSGTVYAVDMDLKQDSDFQQIMMPTRTNANIFPFNTFEVPSTKKFVLNGVDLYYGNSQTENLVEMRYPPPYQDLFILFDNGMTKVLCYGQYSDWNDAIDSFDDPLSKVGPYNLIFGLDVQGTRNSTHVEKELIYENTSVNSNNPYVGSPSARWEEVRFDFNDGDLSNETYPKSYLMSFNVATETDKDSAIKIFLKPNSVKIPEIGYTTQRSVPNLGSVEFHMYPNTDCTLATESAYQSDVLMDDIYIGRAGISPKDLSSFETLSYFGTGEVKKFYKDIKVSVNNSTGAASFNQILETTTFATSESLFSDGVVFRNSANVTYSELTEIDGYGRVAFYNESQIPLWYSHVSPRAVVGRFTYGAGDPVYDEGDQVYILYPNWDIQGADVWDYYDGTPAVGSLGEYVASDNYRLVIEGSTNGLDGAYYITTVIPGSINLLAFSTRPFGENPGLMPDIQGVFSVKIVDISEEVSEKYDTIFNGSFKLKIPPEYDFVPYYHPNAISLLDSTLDDNPAVPHIYNADQPDVSTNTIGWDSFYLNTSTEDDDGLVKSSFMFDGDFVRFFSSSRYLSQLGPFFTNLVKSDELDGTINYIGKIHNHNIPGAIFETKEFGDFGTLGFTSFYNGYSYDGIRYNKINTGLFAIGSLEKTTGLCEIYLKDFSNFTFRRSIKYEADAGEFIGDNVTDQISPNTVTDSYGFGGNLDVLTSLSTTASDHVPAWLYALVDDESFSQSFISYDISDQGHYGDDAIKIEDWIVSSGINNSFGGSYILEGESKLNVLSVPYTAYTNEQIHRLVSNIPSTGSGTFLRGDLDSLTIDNGDFGIITGDTFALGNLFGKVVPKTGNGNIRVFFDVQETVSGISEYRYFYQQIATESVDASQHIGTLDDASNIKNKIVMQTLNNKAINESNLILSDAYVDVANCRSPFNIAQAFLENSPSYSRWISLSNTTDIRDDTYNTGHGINRLYCDLALPISGYSMLYLQVRDKAGNESQMYPFAVKSSFTDLDVEQVTFVDVSVDDGNLLTYNETVNGYDFIRSVARSDRDSSRSIIVKEILSKSVDSTTVPPTVTYINYENSDSLLVGFSDNFGLYYNSFSPLSSVNSWDFSRPIPIKIKANHPWQFWETVPDWLFDPNDIRHYSVDNIRELDAFTNLPGNMGLVPITIIGLMDESDGLDNIDEALGKVNPLAKKIYEFREELIGKKLVLGSDISQRFDILHIFKTTTASNIHSVGRYWPKSEDEPTSYVSKTIDSNTRFKVWIVIEDPDAICAMGLSRRFQYFPVGGNGDLSAELSAAAAGYKYLTGWRQYPSDKGRKTDLIKYDNTLAGWDPFGDRPYIFGYPQQWEIGDSVNAIVDNIMGITADRNGIPTNNPYEWNDFENYGSWKATHETFYIDPSQSTSKDSGISTKEGWITTIYKRYDAEGTSGYDVWNTLRQHNVVGITMFDRLVFGQSYTINRTIASIDSTTNTVILDSGKLSSEIGGGTSGDGFSYSILEGTTVLETGEIIDVSDDGECVIVDSDLDFTMDGVSIYTLRIVVSPLQSTNPLTEETYTIGWWPDVDGFMVPADRGIFGSVTYTDIADGKDLEFAVISSGGFYIDTDGYYTFKIEADSDASAVDFCVDYMRATGDITGIIYNTTTLAHQSGVIVGGIVNTESTKTFYLKKGWHIGRFRYHSVSGQNLRYARVLYRKPGWLATEWTPFLASRNNQNKYFWGKSVRTVHCKLIDKEGVRFPKDDISNSRTSQSQYLRAITAFDNLTSKPSTSFADRVVWVERTNSSVTESLTETTDPYYFGSTIQSSKSVHGRTYGAQVFEEAYGIYESNVFDGGADLRFWRELRWSPDTQPTGTSVELYVRTAPSEKELIGTEGIGGRKWNNVGTDDSEIILPAFTDPTVTNNLLRFTQQLNSINSLETEINRFIQFKMILRSRNQNVVPTVNDVTIVYSKENSVNFFTSTFNLESNLKRAILTYNGDGMATTDEIALTDIQFGICTEEEADGTVSTNFDDYTSIPANEAFDLSSIGVSENDKFRIGIRFISSSEVVPQIDEFCFMWQTDGTKQQVRDIKSSL